MSEMLTLAASERSALGKENKALRRSGLVPLHLIGHNIETRTLQAEEKALRHTLDRAGGSDLVRLTVDGATVNVQVRKVQRHPVSRALIHVDLYQVRMDEKSQVRMPLVLVGQSPAVRDLDGLLQQHLDTLHVEGLPGDLPHNIEVDLSVVTELEQSVHVKDLTIPSTVTVLDDPEELVLKVQAPRRAEVPAGAAAAPEAEAPAS